MLVTNLKIINPEILNDISDESLVNSIFQEYSVVADLGDKSYNEGEISTPLFDIFKNTYIYESITKTYEIDESEELSFFLDFSKMLSKIEFNSSLELQTHIENELHKYFKEFIGSDDSIDSDLLGRIDSNSDLSKITSNLEFITQLSTGVFAATFLDNIALNSTIFMIVKDGVNTGKSREEIFHQIDLLLENYE